jgi:hypothetical protein
MNMRRIVMTSSLLALMAMMSACIIGPRGGYREGSYDRDHNRYYHENAWHGCVEHDEHCR